MEEVMMSQEFGKHIQNLNKQRQIKPKNTSKDMEAEEHLPSLIQWMYVESLFNKCKHMQKSFKCQPYG